MIFGVNKSEKLSVLQIIKNDANEQLVGHVFQEQVK